MVSLAPEQLHCRELLNHILQRRGPIDWLDWLPLAQIAADAPSSWIAAVASLALEQQFDLVDCLRLSDAGPLADTLLLMLAHYANEIQDEQVRENILEDARTARERHGERLRGIRERIAPLAAKIEDGSRRLRKDFDLALEINRLEQELTEQRHAENEQDERFARVHALERELLRLETRKRILAHYDEQERASHLETLRAAVNERQARKEALEEHIAQAMAERDDKQQEIEDLEAQGQTVQEALATQNAHMEQVRQQSAAHQQNLEQRRNEETALQAEHSTLLREITEQEERMRKLQAALAAERKRLLELQESSQRAGLGELEGKVQEVYALLPDDLADGATK